MKNRFLNYISDNISVAHCNFNLRGDEANGDEEFVTRIVKSNNTPFYSTNFDTKKYAEEKGISIQMAARDLRYNWFEKIRKENNFDYIAIAHNKDDIVETFLINLTRGTGIKGLKGIKAKSNNIIRPLLFASRKEIISYCTENNYIYREDSSNKSTTYSRNKIRHNIIPSFEEINVNFKNTIIETISRLSQVEEIYSSKIESKKDETISYSNDKIYLAIEKLFDLSSIETYLHEFLSPYNFNTQQISNIILSLRGISGKIFESSTHSLLRDRDYLIIDKKTEDSFNKAYIDADEKNIFSPIKLSIKRYTKTNDFKFSKESNTAFLDADKIEYPLIVRKWQQGDYFMPLGMKNLKKLSDFFIDNKISIYYKEKTWILESSNKIVWIIDMRIDDRYKITKHTKNILEIKFETLIKIMI
jgi:tRNA(Ile)-lysidine synthase